MSESSCAHCNDLRTLLAAEQEKTKAIIERIDRVRTALPVFSDEREALNEIMQTLDEVVK